MFLSTALLSTTFTMDTTATVTTGAAHGWSVGDKIRVSSGTTLPAGLSASTDYYVTKVISTTEVEISAAEGGAKITSTDAGTGTHTAVLKSRKILIADFRNANLSIHTANSANFTVKLQGSTQDDVDFESAASATNRWDYIQMVDLQSGATVDGDTGVAPAGSDDDREFAVNADGLRWLCLDITSWTAGTLDARVALYE
jgi:hypothetical protein